MSLIDLQYLDDIARDIVYPTQFLFDIIKDQDSEELRERYSWYRISLGISLPDDDVTLQDFRSFLLENIHLYSQDRVSQLPDLKLRYLAQRTRLMMKDGFKISNISYLSSLLNTN